MTKEEALLLDQDGFFSYRDECGVFRVIGSKSSEEGWYYAKYKNEMDAYLEVLELEESKNKNNS